jgi:adenosylcobinamide-GDP ribazoletransferase
MIPRGFIIAVQFLTRLPTPRIGDLQPRDLSLSAAFFPLVGAIIGAAVALAVWGLRPVDPWIGALAGVILWVWITGGLHLDGLGDVADAFGASHRAPERFLAVLSDPHTGSFAVMAIALQIASKLVLLASMPATALPWALILIPAWARFGTLAWSITVPSLRPGLAERFSSDIRWPMIAAWGAVLIGASAWVAVPVLAALVIIPLGSLFWRWRLGGINGDCLGASIEVTESLLLLAIVLGKAW